MSPVVGQTNLLRQAGYTEEDVFVDAPFKWPLSLTSGRARNVAKRNGCMWCHLWCFPGNEDKLHEIAGKAGMKKSWFQNKKPNFPHYDIVPSRLSAVFKAGAVQWSLRDYILYLRLTGR